MRAMILDRVAPLSEVREPLRMAEFPDPVPGPREVLVRVRACGVCHTELDEIEGRLAPSLLPIIPGHQIIGTVERCGAEAQRFQLADRVGIGWIHHSTGTESENLSSEFCATGCDVHGGYAEYITVPEDYAAPIPDSLADVEAAPLMCAGAIGYRSLRLTNIGDGKSLGLMGFGSSGHLVLQTARHLYPNTDVYVFDRSESVREFSRSLGAVWSGAIDEMPPRQLDAVIDTTPAWKPLVESMKKLAPGGRLVINAIRKTEDDKSELLGLSYHDHLWMEREIKSVANLTHFDIAEFLPLAGQIPLRPTVTTYPLHAANDALQSLNAGSVRGSVVLVVD